MDNWTTVKEEFADSYGNLSPSMSRNSFYQHQHVPTNNQSMVVPSSPSSRNNIDSESIQQLKVAMAKILTTLERLETRLNKVEQTTSQILKQQQETLTVPFMSQSEIDKARQVAEQLEQDTNVAKQLQAAYNKEIEVRKNVTTTTTRTTNSLSSAPMMSHQSYQDCPICGIRVSQTDLEVHVDNCLEMFSNDPKKETQVQETKKKMETGFFGKFFKSTKTETTKVVSQSSSPNAPLLENRPISNTGNVNEAMMNVPSIYPSFAPYPTSYPSPSPFHSINSSGQTPMMMPMYMYPSYPPMNQHHQE